MGQSVEWAWLNGTVMPLVDVHVSPEDRGFLFADGVYEVIRIYHGKCFTLGEHLERLWRSAVGIQLTPPMTIDELAGQVRQLVTRSQVRDGMVYLQLTRGGGPRNHVYPSDSRPTLMFFVRELPSPPPPGTGEGVKLLGVMDERWKRCWIKSIALLPNVLAKNAAVAAGADEAVFVEHGIVSECSTANLFAVIHGKLLTHPVGSKVLGGITRAVVLQCAHQLGIASDERELREDEIVRAEELFITSTTRELAWVARYNDRYIGQGRCGPLTLKLHHEYRQRVNAETAK